MFGEFIKKKRLSLNLTLREFCRRIDEDPSNWSKVERGIINPPKKKAKLGKIAKVLKIQKGSHEWNTLVDMAVVEAGTIPDYVMTDKEVLKSLPAFFRTIGSVKPTRKEILELIDRLKKSATPADD